jgi:glutathione S-transferase
MYSPSSPFVRKVMACAVARGLDGQLELITANANASPPVLLEVNPLSKVPALVTDDGVSLYDSPVICEYLDSLGDAVALFPPAGGARWRALKFQALGDGMMDAAVLRRGELLRPSDPARDHVMARQKAAVARSLDELEADLPHRVIDIGTIAVACALGYLDFRYADEPWRESHPLLAEWLAAVETNPCLASTAPREPT